jgi:hypothetical protein
MNRVTLPAFAAAGLGLAVLGSAPAAWAGEGDGAPHVAIAQELSGDLELEFEVEAGLDESTTPPTLTLDVSAFDSFLGAYRTFAVNSTPSPNDDLGFVSEVEGSGTEGGAINGDIVVRMLQKSSNFEAYLGDPTQSANEIFTNASPDLNLGNQFDTHPIWVAANVQGDFTPATGSFEVFDISGGAIGNGAESLGQFDVVLAVPEPTTAGLLAAGGLLALRRRRQA